MVLFLNFCDVDWNCSQQPANKSPQRRGFFGGKRRYGVFSMGWFIWDFFGPCDWNGIVMESHDTVCEPPSLRACLLVCTYSTVDMSIIHPSDGTVTPTQLSTASHVAAFLVPSPSRRPPIGSFLTSSSLEVASKVASCLYGAPEMLPWPVCWILKPWNQCPKKWRHHCALHSSWRPGWTKNWTSTQSIQIHTVSIAFMAFVFTIFPNTTRWLGNSK